MKNPWQCLHFSKGLIFFILLVSKSYCDDSSREIHLSVESEIDEQIIPAEIDKTLGSNESENSTTQLTPVDTSELESNSIVETSTKSVETNSVTVDCESKLLPGQFLCNELISIDPETQQLSGCQKDTERARIPCEAAPGIVCRETGNRTFTREVPCKWTNGKYFDTALLLSIFLGFFGADRFYLGYPALGLLKCSTLGFFFLGHLLDIILIASQVVGPADGSHYIISYFGPSLDILGINSDTARKPQADWF